MLRYVEFVGSAEDDFFSGNVGTLQFGLRGEDAFFDNPGNEFTTFAGGPGNDTYVINSPDTAITILDTSGGGDTVRISGIGFNRDTSFADIVEGQHLLAYDTASGQQVLILDWEDPARRIEFFETSDGLMSFDQVRAQLFDNQGFSGNISWEESGIVEGFDGEEAEEALSFYARAFYDQFEPVAGSNWPRKDSRFNELECFGGQIDPLG